MGEMGSMIAGGADYLTPTDFAHALGLSRGETVREWCAEGKIPGAFRVSDKGKGRWRIPRTSLEEYVRQRHEELQLALAPRENRGHAGWEYGCPGAGKAVPVLHANPAGVQPGAAGARAAGRKETGMRLGELIIDALHEAVQEIAEFLEPFVVIGAAAYLVAQVIRVMVR